MQRLHESENGDILEHITNQRLAENHCALSAEISGVRERVRRILLNWEMHFPVRGSLQEDDGGRCLREGLDEGAHKRDGGKVCAECRDCRSQRTGCFRIKFNTNQLVDSYVL